ncbi:hypothetical protein AB1Y20_005715 [Prymnesium parvum]|uniref:Uncharacterized protein n=1 Tax=Prymnesium parvum TaxID=97485 RepID=A0AB34IZM3_PRYPA
MPGFHAELASEDARSDEELSRLHANISLALLQLGQPMQAAAAASESIARCPHWAKGHFRRASRLRSSPPPPYSWKGAALSAAHEPAAAVASFATACRLAPCEAQLRQLHREISRCLACTAAPAAPLRTRVVPLCAPRFSPIDPALRAHLEREGFVVVAGGVDAAEVLSLRALLWDHLRHAAAMERGAPLTWADERFARVGPPQLGLVTWGAIGQSELLWRARLAPSVGAAFETAWGGGGGMPLLTSFDGAVAFRPPQLNASWRTRDALEWLHVDQGATKRGMAALQGLLLLWGQDSASGGFVCIPGSHMRHNLLVAPHQTADYVAIDANDARLADLDDARLICARAGDLILWDSRCVHASCPADVAAPLPLEEEEEAEGVRGRPRLARAAALVCMVPAEPQLARRPTLPEERARLVLSGVTTTHWPQDLTATSRGAVLPTGDSCRESAEARSLVRGEVCLTRSRHRSAEISKAALAAMFGTS